MSDSNVKIEIHLIQNFAPSNLNRDDTGQPKSATFGGFRRARISSQCAKRAVRAWWREHNTATVGERTKRLQQLIFDKLANDSEFTAKVPDPETQQAGIRIFTDAYYAASDKKKPDKTNVLIFVGPDETDVCAQAIKEIWGDQTGGGRKAQASIAFILEALTSQRKKAGKKKTPEVRDESEEQLELEQGGDKQASKLEPLKEILERIKAAQLSADIALFGRMLAEQPGRNTDGACQVAHPISTHKIDMEMDFYTAVDDLNPEEETGAGMMGIVGFNSACYYRYALVDRDQLARNLAGKTERTNGKWAKEIKPEDYQEADKVIKAFLEAMVYAVPTGKQHSFAAQNLPSFGLFVRRHGGVPISLANAFAKPIRPSKDKDDLVGLSVDRLTKHWKALKKAYGDQGVLVTSCFQIEQEDSLNELGSSDKGSVEKAIGAVMEDGRGDEPAVHPSPQA